VIHNLGIKITMILTSNWIYLHRQTNSKQYYDLSFRTIFNDLKRPRNNISRSGQYSTLCMSL